MLRWIMVAISTKTVIFTFGTVFGNQCFSFGVIHVLK